eukprot:TRINITY_DN8576_c0_g1_i2.p1 TRINITY_DN8576_c0_g1~~TRINITY_DN8576_c0_g1_i2.p1  ORF type:complete len:552 (+),score=101.48 TRINITY_DN8576_c0_g1_i2:29-1657(+)
MASPGPSGGVSNMYSYIVAFAAGMGGFLFGYEIGIIDQVLTMPGFALMFGLKEISYDDHGGDGILVSTPASADITGWITFSFLVGCVLGAAFSSYLTDAIGRRFSIFGGGTMFMIGGILQAASSSLYMFYTGRFISGMGVGLMSAAVPLFIAETARSSVRGKLISIYQLMITFGIVVASCINAIIISTTSGDLEWRLALAIQVIPAFVLWGLIIILPFSPRWLLMRGKIDLSRRTLARLRSLPVDSPEIEKEFRDILEGYELEKRVGEASLRELLRKGIRNRVVLAITIQMLQQWTGINVILYYASSIFESMGFGVDNSSKLFVIVNSFVVFFATIPGIWLVERVGRKRCLVVGGLALGLSHLGVALFYGLSLRVQTSPSLAWGAVICIYLFTLSFASTWGPIAWVYQSEIFPLRVRAKGQALGTMSNWVWNAIIAKISPLLLANIGYYTYVIFGGMGIIMCLFVLFFIPETRGRTLEEMDEVFGYNSSSSSSSSADVYDDAASSSSSLLLSSPSSSSAMTTTTHSNSKMMIMGDEYQPLVS